MNRQLLSLIGYATAFGIFILGILLFTARPAVAPIGQLKDPVITQPETVWLGFDGRNATFSIDGTPVTLVNGQSEVPAAPGSASKITTRYFGQEAGGDLNGDGVTDSAFMITQSTGGTGLFYYVVVALKTKTGYTLTNAFLIGDRIAPQSNFIPKDSQELQVNYAERKPGEPMTAQPSQGATKILKVTSSGVLEGVSK
jgi:hypothetical protein